MKPDSPPITTLTNRQAPLQSSNAYAYSPSAQDMEKLKICHPGLFSLLGSLKEQQPMPDTELPTHFFQPYPAHLNLCLNKITYYYVCRTCKQNPYYKVCSDCFDLDFHRSHNYFIEIGKGECDCGSAGCENLCKNHQPAIDYHSYLPEPEEKYLVYSTFVVQFFHAILGMSQTDRKKHLKLFHDILTKLTKLNQQSPSYIPVSCFCLSSAQNHRQSILFRLLQANVKENFLAESSCSFFKVLLSSASFQLSLLEIVFTMEEIYHSLEPLRMLQGTVQKLLKSHMVVGQLAKRSKLIFPHCIFSVHPEYWNLIQALMIFSSRHPVEQSLVAIMKLIFARYGHRSFNECRKKQVVQFFLSRISSDRGLLSMVVSQLVEKKTFAQITENSSDSEWFNMIVRIVLYAQNGEVDQFPLFFTSFKLEHLKNLVGYFFKQAFRPKNKCKFNGLTATCLFKLAQSYGFVDLLNNLPKVSEISCQHFSNNLIVVFRNLVASDHLTAFWLLKIAQYRGDERKVVQYRRKIAEWFQDFLHLRKEVPQRTIESLRKQELINFQQAAHILRSQTEYQADRRVYVYKGRERKANPNLYLASLRKQFHLHHLKHGSYDDFSCDSHKVDIFIALYTQNINKVSLQNYMSYPKEEIYMISVTAVILDKILGGRCQNVSKYAQNLKALAQKLKKSNHKIDSLFELKERSKFIKPTHSEVKMEIIRSFQPQECSQVVFEKTGNAERQKSASQLETSRKRAEKMRKIKQKFEKKSNKYSQHSLKQVVEEEVCLICREGRGKPKEKSFLYYLGSVKSDEMTQLVLGGDKNEQILTSCFHPFHQKCLAHHNRTTCMLCKTGGNLILPVINQNPESQLFLAAWWNDFLSLKSFAPKGNQGYYYNSQPKTPAADPLVEKAEQLELMERPYKNFLIVYRLLALRLSSLFGKAKLEDAIKKHTYFLHLIENLYGRSGEAEQQQIRKEIEYFQKIVSDSKVTEYVKDLIICSSKAIMSKLANNDDVLKITQKCRQVMRAYPKKLTEDFINNISWLLNQKIGLESVEQKDERLSNSEIIHYVYNVNLPNTMAEFYRSREKCKGCSRMTWWFCIFCRQNGCRNCQSILNHSRNKHSNGTVLAIQANGNLATVLKGAGSQQYELYYDIFNCHFREESTNLEQFRYSPVKLNKALETIFKKF